MEHPAGDCGNKVEQIQPHYIIMQLPDGGSSGVHLMLLFTPNTKQNDRLALCTFRW